MRVPLPLHGDTSNLALHRQAMAQMARVLPDGQLAGFRPDYMEHVLVDLGEAHPKLLLKDASARMKARRATRARYLDDCRKNPSRARVG